LYFKFESNYYRNEFKINLLDDLISFSLKIFFIENNRKMHRYIFYENTQRKQYEILIKQK